MREDNGLAAFKFFEDGLQSSVSEVHAVGVREEDKTIELEDVDCVRQLIQGGIDIRQREAGETCKSFRSCMNEFGREFIAPARQSPSPFAIPDVRSRRTYRHDRNVDTGVIHEGDHRLFGPLKRRKPSDGRMKLICLPPEEVGQYVMVSIDRQLLLLRIAGHGVPRL